MVEFKIPNLCVNLVRSENWNRNEAVLKQARASNTAFKSGALFTCCERYGGNSLRLVYPYIHLCQQEFNLKQRYQEAQVFHKGLPPNVQAAMEQGEYLEMEQHVNNPKFSLVKSSFFIFMGFHLSDNNFEAAELNWRRWSKISILLGELKYQGIGIDGVAFYRQTGKINKGNFMYCIFVGLRIKSKLYKVKCLNAIQRLRGNPIPGYVSLFERNQNGMGTPKRYEPRDSARSLSLDLMLDEMVLAEARQEEERRGRRGHRERATKPRT